jgi:hypothetical protein
MITKNAEEWKQDIRHDNALPVKPIGREFSCVSLYFGRQESPFSPAACFFEGADHKEKI